MAFPTPSTQHPRRRLPARPHVDLPTQHCPASPVEADSPLTPTSLRKSSTFHSPSSPSSSCDDPILSIPSLPRRSPTSITGDDYRIRLLGAVDRSLSGIQDFASDDRETLATEPSPVPRVFYSASGAGTSTPSTASTAVPRNRPARRHHASDSGIGSSSSGSVAQGFKPVNATEPSSAAHKQGKIRSGINGAAMTTTHSSSHYRPALSEHACRQIQKHIIVPIVAEESLKPFHMLVRGLPRRVATKEITCLRDLEKVLLLLAPRCSDSKKSFLQFCETSLQCIHTTVDYLNERERTRPDDTPYTNGYFVDLVEQVRQYASIVSAARTQSSEEQPESDNQHNLELVGGLTRTGRPAEFVYSQGDRFVSLRTGQEVTAEELKQGTKRTMDWDEDREGDRSMARRRKSASAAREEQTCSDCGKLFKRPCDLTKHEKTHSRPWKCSEPGCKYHEYGWPTEKECQRHMNDKHSTAPPMFKCHFAPCPYESKRESNCKQHMEKAHGWTYVRSKNNGRVGRRAAAAAAHAGRTPPTPQTDSPASRAFSAQTPEFSVSPEESRRTMPSPMMPEPFIPDTSAPFQDMFGPSAGVPQWQDAATDYPPMNPVTSMPPGGHSLAWDPPSSSGAAFEPAHDDETSLFGCDFNWAAMEPAGALNTSLPNFQLATPAASVGSHMDSAFNAYASYAEQAPLQQPTSLSPTGQGDMMLCSPYSADTADTSAVDETFEDFLPDVTVTRPTGDFSLYDAASPAATSGAPSLRGGNALFGELRDTPTGWSGRGADLAYQLGIPNDAMED